MTPELFQIVLWGATGLLIAGLCALWWRRDARERRDAELARRWRKATLWNPDTSARVVRVSRAEPGHVWLDAGDHEIEVAMPEGTPVLDAGWYVHVAGWMPAARAVSKGRAVTLGGDSVKEVFPPHTPAVDDRLMGRGERKAGFVGRLLGLRGL